MFNTLASNTREAKNSPFSYLPGEEPVWQLTVAGSGTLASPTMKLFKGSSDISSTNLTGSLSVSGRTITTKKATSLVGGSDYAAIVYFTDNGILTGRFWRFSVQKEGAF